MSEKISVIGLGYVGLPVAIAFGKKFDDVVGFDINEKRIEALKKGQDITGETEAEELVASGVQFTSNAADLARASFHIVTVPTPIDGNNQPDLTALEKACETLGKVLKKGDVLVFESTVYPGITEEICGPLLAEFSGLEQSVDFKLGYSPERINPGDKTHRLESIIKVVSGEDKATLQRVSATYGAIIEAGIHEAPTIKVAEAAKVIENTQRDLNIALMNELALIFDRLDICTKDVLAAAGTKWNFLKFFPGLVGGHCIGVDPYYLTAKAESVGYHPEVILAGRRINDNMGAYVAGKAIKLLIAQNKPVRDAKVAVLGLTFKENVPDIRNSRVPDILAELAEFGVQADVHDPHADMDEAKAEYGVELVADADLGECDLLIIAVPHKEYLDGKAQAIIDRMPEGGVVIDVKSALDRTQIEPKQLYWSL